ncbi:MULTISPECIES: response regulator [Ectothiorhodospira]|jgi:twitching motility two-component system response regulator PilH|uniref:Twitching motility two-component system response regulator PilH n=1 Tax=Ectothiorhodospira marina TaxID=1396821 RepID=A0A1H7QP06_9GAMM|nr:MULTISPECIES: response regulator [Ectothiorhodospira]MCG5514748.1 response regulator [Ectothiorhodospira sp. 9100]MCG5518347.1 response regulator [Ectothiorhodospira sp. 9905]SEL49335.1 twitching motility two-component system response regulator PilH [Ectothiorhodospira marina]
MTRILVVDDSPTELHVIKTMLGKHGYEVSTASSGEDGMAKARETLPDLILMDVVMPGLNGFQATRQLSQDAATAKIPVIVVTTKDQETDRVWAMRQGARDYIVKPVKEKDLLERLKDILP